MKSRRDPDAPSRLRVPAVLAVAFVGSSTMVSMWYGGCDPRPPDPTPDAGHIEMVRDAEMPADAVHDAAIVDAPPDDPPQ
jgi:hypothetical protein